MKAWMSLSFLTEVLTSLPLLTDLPMKNSSSPLDNYAEASWEWALKKFAMHQAGNRAVNRIREE